MVLASTMILVSESHGTHDHILLSNGSGSPQTTEVKIEEKFILRLAVYCHSVLGDKPLEVHDQRFFSTEPLRS
jgi:hypothetical protein